MIVPAPPEPITVAVIAWFVRADAVAVSTKYIPAVASSIVSDVAKSPAEAPCTVIDPPV